MTNRFVYDGSARPKWEKVFTAESGEEFSVELMFENYAERQSLTVEEVYEHMGNLLAYAQLNLNSSEIVTLADPIPQTYTPLQGGFPETDWAFEEINKWWRWAYFNEAFDTEEPA